MEKFSSCKQNRSSIYWLIKKLCSLKLWNSSTFKKFFEEWNFKVEIGGNFRVEFGGGLELKLVESNKFTVQSSPTKNFSN